MCGCSFPQHCTAAAQAVAQRVQQQQPGSICAVQQARKFNSISSVHLDCVRGLSSLVPDFITEHCPCVTRLVLTGCTIHSLPPVGALLPAWPQLQALTAPLNWGDAVTVAQVTQQLQRLTGLQSLNIFVYGMKNKLWSGVPTTLGSQLTALTVGVLDSDLMPEGCVYSKLTSLYADHAAAEQWAILHQTAPALTHLRVESLTTDDLAGLPISWASQLQCLECCDLIADGEQPDAAVLHVLQAVGKVHVLDLERTYSCSSDLWAVVLQHVQPNKQKFSLRTEKPFTRSDVSLVGQLESSYLSLDSSFEPGVLGSLVQLLPHANTLQVVSTCSLAELAVLICRADRPIKICIDYSAYEDLYPQFQQELGKVLAECGHNFVTLTDL